MERDVVVGAGGLVQLTVTCPFPVSFGAMEMPVAEDGM
jgi:hypothetical protein